MSNRNAKSNRFPLRSILTQAFAAIVALSLPGQSKAAIIDAPILDAFYRDHWNNTYDTFDTGSWYMDAWGSNHYLYPAVSRGVMEIDLSAIAAGSTINSVSLTFRGNTQGDGACADPRLYGRTGDGVLEPGDVAVLGDYLGTTGPWCPLGNYSVTYTIPTAFVESVINSTGWATLQLTDDNFSDNVGARFYTMEYSDPLYRPVFTVDYTAAAASIAEPATLSLVALGLVGGAWSRRRRSRARRRG